jgi:hypothetical protein
MHSPCTNVRTENQKEKDLVFSMRISYCLAVSCLAHTQSHRRNCKAGDLVLLSLTDCFQDSLRHICRQKTNLKLENLTTFNSMCDMRTYYLSDSVQPSHLYDSVLLRFQRSNTKILGNPRPDRQLHGHMSCNQRINSLGNGPLLASIRN